MISPLHSQGRRRTVSWLILACTLFAQAALAAVPCLSPEASPADAFGAMPAGCDEAPPSNLCLAHCVGADQTAGHAEITLAPPATVAITLPPVPALAVPRCPALFRSLTLTCGPPVFLRLCSLLL